MDTATQRLMAGAAGAGAEGAFIDKIFHINSYIGTGSNRTVTTGIDHRLPYFGGPGHMTLIKNKERNSDWYLNSSLHGEAYRGLSTSSTGGQSSSNGNAHFSWTSTGYTTGGGDGRTNASGENILSFTWANEPGFFQYLSYTGTGGSESISHSLESVPGMIWFKCNTHSGTEWYVYHRETNGGTSDENYYTRLNRSNAKSSSDNIFNYYAPTSTNFEVRDELNESGKTYHVFLFAHNEAIFGKDGDAVVSKCGSYVGTGNGLNTNHIDLGFVPQLVMIKRASGSGNWGLFNNMTGVRYDRSYYMDINEGTQYDYAQRVNFTEKGFELTSSDSNVNTGGSRYIYYAVRKIDGIVGEAKDNGYDYWDADFGADQGPNNCFDNDHTSGSSGWPVSALWDKKHDSSSHSWEFAYRPMVEKMFKTSNTNANSGWANQGAYNYRHMTGCTTSHGTTSYVEYMWRDGPGHDTFIYYGNGSTHNIPHSMGQTPEMVLIKRKNSGSPPILWHKAMGSGKAARIDDTSSWYNLSTGFTNTTNSSYWNETHFQIGSSGDLNINNELYVAQLFASVAGISKLGSFNGGIGVTVTTGFQPRFLLIKDQVASNWFVMDYRNGLSTSTNSTRALKLNVNHARSSLGSYAKALSTGFQIEGEFNDSSHTYLYYAHA